MLELGLQPRSSYPVNICIEFSVLCLRNEVHEDVWYETLSLNFMLKCIINTKYKVPNIKLALYRVF
jgi:hypothetical protein